MADSAIGNLPSISTDLTSTDLFVLERNGYARKVSGEQLSDFMDRSVLAITITALSSTADLTYSYNSSTGTLSIGLPVGQGISAITYQSTSGLVDTYGVYRDDGTLVDTITVTNGSSISSIARTSGDGSSGSTDTYTITLTNGNTHTFSVYNGADGQGTVDSVDGVSPASGSTNVELYALTYGSGQSLTSTQKAQAWANLTGLAGYPSVLTNLASTSAASAIQASPRPGVTGTLPISNGGTGGTTAAGARSALGMGFVIGETGTISASGTPDTNPHDWDIVFTHTYTDSNNNAVTPYILVMGASASCSVYGTPTVQSSSATGATIRIKYLSTHSGTATFRWYAIVDAGTTIS